MQLLFDLDATTLKLHDEWFGLPDAVRPLESESLSVTINPSASLWEMQLRITGGRVAGCMLRITIAGPPRRRWLMCACAWCTSAMTVLRHGSEVGRVVAEDVGVAPFPKRLEVGGTSSTYVELS